VCACCERGCINNECKGPVGLGERGGGTVLGRLLLPFVYESKQAIARLMCNKNQQHWVEKPVTTTGVASYPFVVSIQQGWPNCAM
jgi:hypothetical protein